MKKLTIEEKAKRYDEVLNRAKGLYAKGAPYSLYLEEMFPELKEEEDIRKALIEYYSFDEDGHSHALDNITPEQIVDWLEKQSEIDKTHYDVAEKEKYDFVSDGFIKCYANFQDFKEGETYSLEYLGNDNYNVSSVNLLGKIYHITPYQLYAIFKKQTGLKKQGESMETNPDEIIEECHQDNADHIIDIVTEQEKPSEWNEEDEKIMSIIMEEGDLKPSERHWLKSLKERVQSKTRKKNIEQNLAKKYGITGIGSKHAEGKLGEMTKKKIETENVDNTNKVEPKFKVGDWLQYRNAKPFYVEGITSQGYVNGISCLPFSWEDEIHLWSIADAQAGDVLVASDGSIFLFAGVVDCACKYYVSLTTGNYVKINKNKEVKGGYWETSRAVHPATKEQCALLFQKMREAGYNWDANKKELKEI